MMYFSNFRKWAMIATIIGTTTTTQAQFVINNLAETDSITFSDFDASGFSTTPSIGQLSSNTWSILGLSAGDLNFSDDGSNDDYGRGTSSGGVTTGGVYAFSTGTAIALGVQSIASDMTPGDIILKVENGTGTSIDEISVAYQIYSYNDEARSSSISFSYSVDNVSYTSVPDLDYFSQEASDVIPEWDSTKFSTSFATSLTNNDVIYLKWSFDDFEGLGSRDELGISRIRISEDFSTSIEEEKSKVELFPNPTNGSFTVNLTDKVESVEVYNLAGHLQVSSNNQAIDISNLPNGTYMVKTTTSKGSSIQKLVKIN